MCTRTEPANFARFSAMGRRPAEQFQRLSASPAFSSLVLAVRSPPFQRRGRPQHGSPQGLRTCAFCSSPSKGRNGGRTGRIPPPTRKEGLEAGARGPAGILGPPRPVQSNPCSGNPVGSISGNHPSGGGSIEGLWAYRQGGLSEGPQAQSDGVRGPSEFFTSWEGGRKPKPLGVVVKGQNPLARENLRLPGFLRHQLPQIALGKRVSLLVLRKIRGRLLKTDCFPLSFPRLTTKARQTLKLNPQATEQDEVSQQQEPSKFFPLPSANKPLTVPMPVSFKQVI